jgi:hypothetical protein
MFFVAAWEFPCKLEVVREELNLFRANLLLQDEFIILIKNIYTNVKHL